MNSPPLEVELYQIMAYPLNTRQYVATYTQDLSMHSASTVQC